MIMMYGKLAEHEAASGLSFEELRILRDSGCSFAAVLVLAYHQSHGDHPPCRVADACGLTERSVFRALNKLRNLSILPWRRSIPFTLKSDEVLTE